MLDDAAIPDERLELAVHLLPSGARARRAGRADAADARRPDHRGDRARLPGAGGDDDEAAVRAKRRSRPPGSRSASRRRTCSRPARRRARRRLPDLQRGLRRAAASWRREAIRLGRALAELMPDEPEVARAARADARQRRAPRGALRRRRRRHAARPGPLALGPRSDRGRDAPARPRRSRYGDEGPYVLQAALAVLHSDEPQDWPQIAALYGELARASPARPWSSSTGAVAIAEAGDVEGAPRARRRARPRSLPLPARDPRRAPAAPRAHRGGALGLRSGAGARPLRRRAHPARAAGWRSWDGRARPRPTPAAPRRRARAAGRPTSTPGSPPLTSRQRLPGTAVLLLGRLDPDGGNAAREPHRRST